MGGCGCDCVSEGVCGWDSLDCFLKVRTSMCVGGGGVRVWVGGCDCVGVGVIVCVCVGVIMWVRRL